LLAWEKKRNLSRVAMSYTRWLPAAPIICRDQCRAAWHALIDEVQHDDCGKSDSREHNVMAHRARGDGRPGARDRAPPAL